MAISAHTHRWQQVVLPLVSKPTQRAQFRAHLSQMDNPQQPAGGFNPFPLLLLAGIALVIFLFVKFPLVLLIVLGALVVTALVVLISLTTGHWAFG